MPKLTVMTEEQKNEIRQVLYNKSVRELIEMIIVMQDEVEEAKKIRRRFLQIRNLVLEPAERSRPGRPRTR